MNALEIKVGDRRTVSFTVRGPSVAQIAAASFQFAIKKDKDDFAPIVNKAPTDFDLSEAASRIVKVALSTAETNQSPGAYCGELKMQVAGGDEIRSADIPMVFLKSVLPPLTPQPTYLSMVSDEVTLSV